MYQVKIEKISFTGKKMIKHTLDDISYRQKHRDFYRHFVFLNIESSTIVRRGGQNVFNKKI